MNAVNSPRGIDPANDGAIPKSAIESFQTHGCMVLERCVSPDDVAMMRGACEALIAQGRAHTDNSAGGREHKFLFGAAKQRPELDRFNFGPLMAALCRATLGPDAWHVND